MKCGACVLRDAFFFSSTSPKPHSPLDTESRSKEQILGKDHKYFSHDLVNFLPLNQASGNGKKEEVNGEEIGERR